MSRLSLTSLQDALRQAIPFLSRQKGSLPRGEMLALKPTRSREVAWEMKAEEAETPGATLTVPRRDDQVGRLLSRAFRIPATRTVELDEFGAQVWARCDGTHSVEQLIHFTCETYKLNRRQGEVSVITFMRMLAQRNLIGLKPGAIKTLGAGTHGAGTLGAATLGKGTANVHRGDGQRSGAGRRRRRH